MVCAKVWSWSWSWSCSYPGYMLREETGREKVVIRQIKRAWNLEEKLRRGNGSEMEDFG